MHIISRKQILLIIWRVDGVDWSHVLTRKNGLVNSLECVLNFFQFGQVQILASRFCHLFETLLKQFPDLNVSLIGCYQFLILSLSCQPLHVIYCLSNLLTFERVELSAVGLEFGVIFKIFVFFLCVLLELKYNDSSCMVT